MRVRTSRGTYRRHITAPQIGVRVEVPQIGVRVEVPQIGVRVTVEV